MAEFKFSEEPSLGQVVNPSYKVFCNWSPKTPIKNVYKITRDVCGHKFSTICGFTFTSSLDVPFFVKYPELKLNLQYGIDSATFYPTFQVVYCPKSRSNYVRNDRGLSGWYLWQHRAVDNKQIMSLRDLYAYYGFDVAKFFQSDVFQKYLPLFKKQISAAYGTVVQDFLSNMKDDQFGYSVNNAKFFAKCTYDSLEKIGDVLKVNWEKPDQMKAKLAYNADDTYSLNAKSVPNLDQTSGVEATGTEMKTEESEEEVIESESDEICEESLDDPNEITEADSDSEKSRKLWSKAENMFSEAAKAYDTLKTYMDLVTAAYTHDTTFVPDDAPTMPETKADIAKAGQAIIDLGSAFHFTEA